MELPHYLAMLARAEHTLAGALRAVADQHAADHDVHFACARFAAQGDSRRAALDACRSRYQPSTPEPERLDPPAPGPVRDGPTALLRDLADLRQLAVFVELTWELVGQAARGARDEDLAGACDAAGREITIQVSWLRGRMRAEAAQALLVPAR